LPDLRYTVVGMRLGHVAVGIMLLVACEHFPEVLDQGRVCASAVESDGVHILVVEASSLDCASDHKGATFDCSIAVDGLVVTVHTKFRDGKDPDSGCASPLRDTCEIVLEPGTYTLEFGDQMETMVVPSGEDVCIPERDPGLASSSGTGSTSTETSTSGSTGG
jgi:hypothetical protein